MALCHALVTEPLMLVRYSFEVDYKVFNNFFVMDREPIEVDLHAICQSNT